MRSDAHDDEMPEDAGRADEFHRLEQSYVREERWEDLAGLLIERIESVADAAERSHYLMRAAQIFETNLADPDRAFITLLAAFQEDLRTTNWPPTLRAWHCAQPLQDLLAECNSLVAPRWRRSPSVPTCWWPWQAGTQTRSQRCRLRRSSRWKQPWRPIRKLAALNSLVTLYSQRATGHAWRPI